jgi:DnaJ-class molecular chaperone
MKVTREVLCVGCSGTGCLPGASENVSGHFNTSPCSQSCLSMVPSHLALSQTCVECRGRGMKVTVIQRGPMIQQMQSPCTACRGQGKIVRPQDQCKTCNGKKTVEERKVLEVHIEKGMKAGDKIVFAGMSDEAPGMEAGDIVFAIQVTRDVCLLLPCPSCWR